eukprot:1008653-Pleurochrysis_carterae.AAC.3
MSCCLTWTQLVYCSVYNRGAAKAILKQEGRIAARAACVLEQVEDLKGERWISGGGRQAGV